MDWTLAACRDHDPELFFPLDGATGTISAAKAVCAGCPLRSQCLDYALTTGVVGVWGGTTDTERRTLRRKGVTA